MIVTNVNASIGIKYSVNYNTFEVQLGLSGEPEPGEDPSELLASMARTLRDEARGVFKKDEKFRDAFNAEAAKRIAMTAKS